MKSATGNTVLRRDVIGWSLYDFANTIYSMNIVSLYLKRYIVQDLGYDDRYFDIPFSASMLLAALILPALGALSDHSTKKKIFLFLFTIACCSAVGLLATVPSWAIGAVITLFIVANFSYEAGQPFYNALLYSVSDGTQARFVSGLGVALGYVGSIVGMIMVLPFVTGEFFGAEIAFLAAGGKSAAFLPTAVLFFLFSVPLFLWVKERKALQKTQSGIARAYRDVWNGIRQTRKYPGVLRFLIADYFIEDAVSTVILNIGIYCAIVLGMAEELITTFLVISTITAVAGSFAIGWLARRYSLKLLLNIIIVGWIASLLMFAFTTNTTTVWILGSAVGVLLGGLWTTTRPLLAELVPRDELGRFFGLFSLSGRAAAVIGPLIWTAVVFLFQPDRPAGVWLSQLLALEGEAARVLP
ncbi:MAG: MFS transporter, partial [candidate division Zixibacteria bacterium]|nr:MFS transporter [candidate division Zixibacteria bacterium]